MCYSGSHRPDIQHEVKLADGERNSMIMLLLASPVAVFPCFFLPISLHPPITELLLVEQSFRHASAALDRETRVRGTCGFGFPFTSESIRMTSVWLGGGSAQSGGFLQIAGIHLSARLWSLVPSRVWVFLQQKLGEANVKTHICRAEPFQWYSFIVELQAETNNYFHYQLVF